MKKQVKELNPERAIALLGNKEVDEEKLTKTLERIKAFCKVAYQLYLNDINSDKPIAIVKQLESKPPEKFTNAA